MAGFGGAVKLTGESEYRKALSQITQNLKEVSSQMKVVSTQYDSNDKSTAALNEKYKLLNQTLATQGAKLNTLKEQYASFNSKQQEQIAKHEELKKSYDDEKSKLDVLAKTVGTTSKEYQEQAQKVTQLGNDLDKSQKAIDSNEKSMSNMRIAMNDAQSDINKTAKEIDNLGKEAEESGKKTKNAGDGFTVFKGVLSNLATQGINVAINGLKKLASATISVGKQAIASYAEYEQLVGGVETLFKDSAKTVQDYASKSYKTAGLSANEYMSTVTSFSASLLQGLKGDTEKAAKYADMAIVDMSDNANKMGTSMEMIQNAYQGFAKQNYTMLDNLKLGYGGTKGEMARLVKESGILGKAGDDLTAKNLNQKVSFDQIVKAINITQQRMGITGTTSKEAASTIQGSVNSMKASWRNLLTAIADNNQDMSKSVDEFVKSAITAAKNLVPRIRTSIDGIKKLINSIVTEVFPKLKKEVPELKPLINVFEWFIKNKQLVITAVGGMVAAFAANKILTFTKTISDTAKKILEIATATTTATAATNLNTAAEVTNTATKTAATAATGALTAATNLLNAAWKANPVGLVITGVTALISVVGLLTNKTNELSAAEKKQKDELDAQTNKINENKNAWDELKKSRQANVDAGLTELSYFGTLRDELDTIVDKNGKVKKGYEERASFIVDTLSSALGIEIDKNKSLNKQLKDLMKNIDKVIEKKKAQIILDSQEDAYKEAILKQSDAVRTLDETEEKLDKARAKRDKLEAERNELRRKLKESDSEVLKIQYGDEIIAIDKKIKKKDEEINNLKSNYKTQEELLGEYTYNINQYENNAALYHAGKYDEMTNVNWKYVKDYQKAGDAQKKELQDQIDEEEYHLNWLKAQKDANGNYLYESQVKASEKQLTKLKNDLKKYENTTETGLDATKVKWNNGLDKILSTITGKNVTFKEDGKGNVQMYIDGVKTGDKKSKDEMAKIVSNAINEITSKDKDAKEAGKNLIDGVNNGIKDQNKQSSVFTTISKFGSSLLAKLKNSLKEKSPSKATKEMGQFLLEGLGIGIEDEEDSLLKQVSGVGRSVLSTLQGELNQNLKLGTIQSQLNGSSIKSTTEKDYNNVVEAFKDALSQMKIELDDEVAGNFVENTVAKAIYN